MNFFRSTASIAALGLAVISLANTTEARTFPPMETVTICTAPIEPVAAAGCAILGITIFEAMAERPFSNKGEIAKAGTAARNYIGERTGLKKATKWFRKRTGIKW